MVVSSSTSPLLDKASTTSCGDHAQVAMAASAGCTKKAGVPVDANVAAILQSDMATLAHAGHHHAARALQDQGRRTDEGLARLARQPGPRRPPGPWPR